MKLPRLALEHHQFTLTVILLLVLAGLLSLFTMPRSEDPDIQPPGANIIVIYPGATPGDLEELVMDPLEEAVNELDHLEKVNSSAQDGIMLIQVDFIDSEDPDPLFDDLQQRVNSMREQLPADLLSLDVVQWDISSVAMLQYALVSDSSGYNELRQEAERLEKELVKLPGVRKVESLAYPDQQVIVSVNLEKLAVLKLPLGKVMAAIQSAGRNIPGGYVDINSKRFSIKTSGSFRSIDEIRNTIVHAYAGKVVYLGDVASVELDYEPPTYFARFQKQQAVFVTVTQKKGTNIFDVSSRVKERVEQFAGQLPTGTFLHTVTDQSESVAHRVNGFFINLLQGVGLVGLVVLLTMSFRAAWIVMLVIPVSILIGIGFVDMSGFGLQQMSIAGLVIALGLLVDNAIVVSENVSRFMQMGMSRFEAAAEGTKQIGWPVVSSTVTTILAFLPIVLMSNVTGDFIRSMPVTVIYTLLASLLVSLTLTPYLISRYIRTNDNAKKAPAQRFIDYVIETKYRSRLDSLLKRPRMVLGVSTAALAGSLMLFPIIGVSFFPKAEKPQFLINIDTPPGTSIFETDRIAAEVEALLDGYPDVKHLAVNIGRGNPRIYYNLFPKNERSNHAQIFVTLKVYDLNVFNTVVSSLRRELHAYPGARIQIKEFEQGPPVEAPVAIKVLGENLDELKRIARDVENMVRQAPGTVNIDNPLGTGKTDLYVNINRAKAAGLGIAIADLDQTVRAAMNGVTLSTYRDRSGEAYEVILRAPRHPNSAGVHAARVSDFSRIYLTSASGAQVPLRHLANIEFQSSPMVINHFNMERSITITADVDGSSSVQSTTDQIVAGLAAYEWPKGYRYYVGGEQETRDESFGGMLKAVIIALVAIFAVLVLQFRSFSQPLIVFAAIPLAIIGSILALLITGHSFSFTAFVGITSLVGIVINNSIILVDYTNQLIREGNPLLEALKTACETRFTPIILTTATTVGGLLPLTLGGGTMWAPMGWTIIGGLIVSTLLTLVVVPVLFKIFTSEVTAG